MEISLKCTPIDSSGDALSKFFCVQLDQSSRWVANRRGTDRSRPRATSRPKMRRCAVFRGLSIGASLFRLLQVALRHGRENFNEIEMNELIPLCRRPFIWIILCKCREFFSELNLPPLFFFLNFWRPPEAFTCTIGDPEKKKFHCWRLYFICVGGNPLRSRVVASAPAVFICSRAAPCRSQASRLLHLQLLSTHMCARFKLKRKYEFPPFSTFPPFSSFLSFHHFAIFPPFSRFLGKMTPFWHFPPFSRFPPFSKFPPNSSFPPFHHFVIFHIFSVFRKNDTISTVSAV